MSKDSEMKMSPGFTLLILALSSFAPSSFAAPLNHWMIQEELPNEKVEVKVIEEDEALRANQNVISQQVIYKHVFSSGEVPSLESILANLETSISDRILLSPGPHPMAKPLWVPVKNEWTEADEDAYSNWFATQVDTTFNRGTGLLADCADVGLLFRWVYARNHLLPIANTLSGSGKLFGHFSGSASWDRLKSDSDWKKDERFKAALRYLLDNTYTRTVVGDIYPTFITPQYVRPGSMYMIIRPSSGHTQTIKTIDTTFGITTLWGNEPAAEAIFQSPLIINFGNQETFGRWRWPYLANDQWHLTLADKMPGFSEEQFQQGFTSAYEYQKWMNEKLNIHLTDEARLAMAMPAFYQAVLMRLSITASGLFDCFYTQCDPSSSAYNDYSTFSRDARLKDNRQDILDIIAKMGPTNPTVLAALKGLKGFGEVIFGTGITFDSLLEDPEQMNLLNPDPRVSFLARWGIQDAMVTPTLYFYSLSQSLEALIRQRDGEVLSGYFACLQGCDPNSPSMQVLNTGELDDQIRAMYAKTLVALTIPGVDPLAVGKIQEYFKGLYLTYITNPACLNHNCTYHDVVWADRAQARMSKWSPKANDSLMNRWGF